MAWGNKYFENWGDGYFSFTNKPNDILYTRIAESSIPNFNKFSDNQLKLIKTLDTNSNIIVVKKARQCGESTTTTMHIAISALKSINKRFFILSRNKGYSEHLLDYIRKYYTNIGIRFEDNRYEIRLDNGSIIKADSTSNLLRGYDASIIYITEAAYIMRLNEIINIYYENISYQGKLIISSTPNGLNDFYNLYEGVNNGNIIGNTVDMEFIDNVINDEASYVQKCRMYSPDEIRQEFDAEFF